MLVWRSEASYTLMLAQAAPHCVAKVASQFQTTSTEASLPTSSASEDRAKNSKLHSLGVRRKREEKVPPRPSAFKKVVRSVENLACKLLDVHVL